MGNVESELKSNFLLNLTTIHWFNSLVLKKSLLWLSPNFMAKGVKVAYLNFMEKPFSDYKYSTSGNYVFSVRGSKNCSRV
jgi:hypothetical protein